MTDEQKPVFSHNGKDTIWFQAWHGANTKYPFMKLTDLFDSQEVKVLLQCMCDALNARD